MQKLVVDTNVIVSYCISPLGYSFKILDQIILKRKAQIYISPEIMQEYTGVLSRTRFFRKFPHFREVAENTLINISLFGEYVYPSGKLTVLTDMSDNKFLEAATEAGADYLITGNSNDFNIQEYNGTIICSPRQYWIKFGDILLAKNE